MQHNKKYTCFAHFVFNSFFFPFFSAESEEKDYEAIVKLETSERDSLRDAVLGLCAYETDVDLMLALVRYAFLQVTDGRVIRAGVSVI